MYGKKTYTLFTAAILLLLSSFATLMAQEREITSNEVYPEEISAKAFKLDKDSEVTVKAVWGAFDRWDIYTVFYGWIVKSDDRKVVWHMLERLNENETGKKELETKVTLAAGTYEFYFTGAYDYSMKINDLGGFLTKLFTTKSKYRRKFRGEFKMSVSAPASVFTEVNAEDALKLYTKDAVISITRAGNYENIEKRFGLSAETEFKIQALGEGHSDEMYDHAWLVNAETHEQVWRMRSRKGRFAGGGEKNLYFKDRITLPKGNYILTYVTDDSHSYDGWNVLPPNDPQMWGVTLFLANESDRKNVIAFNEKAIPKPVVEITKVWDDEFLSQGIELKKDVKLRILAIGEGNNHDLADYGWIIDAESRQTVWDMQRENTQHAGGADKNRLVEDEITLDKGKYIVYYKTDDSHSYEEWNSTPPFMKERWGITVWTVDKKDEDYVRLFSENDYKNENIVAQLVRVRDSERLKKNFILNHDTKLRIFAIGEGDRSDMFDYGWIENRKTNRIVWDMTYRKTVHAGGAQKNRMFNDVVILPAGEYTVYYRTDDSHSYRDWNSRPPDDEEMYGITILKLD